MNIKTLKPIWQRNKANVKFFHNVNYHDWLDHVTNKNSDIHDQCVELTFNHFNPEDVPMLLQSGNFIRLWSEYRDKFPESVKESFDSEWSHTVSGNRDIGFNVNLLFLNEKQLYMFQYAATHEPLPIYELAKAIERNYRRTFEAVKILESMGIFTLIEGVRKNRKISIVAVTGVNEDVAKEKYKEYLE